MNSVGRNAPCPCGSGKKFKKCCLAKTAPAPGAFTAGDRESALGRLMRFSARAEFETAHEAAAAVFWDLLEDLPEAEIDQALGFDQSHVAYHDWFVFDFYLENGSTLADLFLAREGHTLTSGEREYLERMRHTHNRLYEVVAVKPEEGLELVDLWTEERLWVRERLATRQLVRWDLLAARVMTGAQGDRVLDGNICLLPAGAKDDILKALRGAYRVFTRHYPDEDVGSFFKRLGMLFHHFWLERVALRPLPTIVTAEGDPMVFAKSVFDVRDRDALIVALGSSPDLQRQDDGSYVWLEDAGEFHRSLGTFAFEGDRLVFEATSTQRAERGRRKLEALAGKAVRYRVTQFQDIDQALKNAPASLPPRSPDIPPEVEARVIGEFYERHYGTWLDRRLPALGNRTPRHAAGLKSVRPRLVSLLKEMENRSERERREGRPAYDFQWMWRELGLERPGGRASTVTLPGTDQGESERSRGSHGQLGFEWRGIS